MAIITTIDIASFFLTAEHRDGLFNQVLDVYNREPPEREPDPQGPYTNPLTIYFARLLAIREDLVEQTFMHFRDFGYWPPHDIADFLDQLPFKRNWWYDTWKLWEPRTHRASCRALFERLGQLDT